MPYQLGEGPTLNLAVRVGVGPTIALSGRPVNSRVQYHSAHRTSSHNARRPQKIASFWGLVCIFALWDMSLRPLSSCRTITLRLCGRWRVCEIMESGLHVFHSTTGHFLCQEIFSRNFIIPKKRGAVPAAPSSLGFCIPKVNALFLTKSIVAQFRLYFQRREVEDLGLTGFRGRAGGGATELFPLLLPVPPHDTPTPAGTASSGTSVEVDIPTAHRICGVVLSCRNDTDCGANERAMFAEAVAIVA